MLNVPRLDTTREGRKWAPPPIWTVASWLQERKKRFPTVAHRPQNEERLKSEAQEQEQDFKAKKEELGHIANGAPGQVKQDYSAENQSKATQLIQQIRETKHRIVAESSTMPRKEARRGVSSTEEEIDAKLEETMDVPLSRNGTPTDQTSQIIATPRKPKTPRSKKSDQKPDPTRQKQISLFARRHKFIMEQSLGTYTTTQRRAFERDVYDFARALGFSKARAKASMLGARTFCGEETYDTDDTRLDDDEIDDSSNVLVSLPLTTGVGTATSSFARSFSAHSPTIPLSSKPAKDGSDILPSVEVRETPQSEGAKGKRSRKSVEGSSTGPKGKRRKTDIDLPMRVSEYNDGNADAGSRPSDSMTRSLPNVYPGQNTRDIYEAQPTPEIYGEQDEPPHSTPEHGNGDKSPTIAAVIETWKIPGGDGDPGADAVVQAKNKQKEQKGQKKGQANSKSKKVKVKQQQPKPTSPTNLGSKKKKKGQDSEAKRQSVNGTAGDTDTSTDGTNGNRDRGTRETLPQASGIDTLGDIKHHQPAEQSASSMSEPVEEKERNGAEQLLDGEDDASREIKKTNFNRFLEQYKVLETQKKAKKEADKASNKKELPKSQQKKTTGVDEQFEIQAQELLRAQNAARRAREDKVTAEDVDNGKEEPAKTTDVENTALQRKEKKIMKREMKKKRKSEGASSTATEAVSHGSPVHSEAVAEYDMAVYEPVEAQSSLVGTDRIKDDTVPERPSTPIQRQTSSTASSPLSSLPSTPEWPTPSRAIIKEEDNKKPKPKRHRHRSETTASGLTPSKRRKYSSKVSHYFSSPKPKREPISCVPFPPLSSTFFGLIQETLQSNPFHLLIAVIFLNKTRGAVAIPVFYNFITRFPDPSSLAVADLSEVVGFFQNLGLQNQRAKKCIGLAKAWMQHPPTKGKRWRRLHYPNLGDGKDIKSSEEPITDEDPRVAWEVGHLPGIGAYGIDSWRIFCRDELRGLGTAKLPELPGGDDDGSSRLEMEKQEMKKEWTRVLPSDKELRAHLRWRWLRLEWDWDPKTGERKKADEEVVKEAEGGGVICEKG